jgi:hypothetical protein
MNRLAMGTVAVAALGILATGCNATVTGSASPDGGTTSTPVSAAPAGGSGGSGTTGHATTGTGSGGGAAGAATPRCHSSGLSASVTGYDAGAGQRYARLVLRNTSGHACRMYGFPGLALGTSSEGFGGTTTRTGTAPAAFVIIPGGHAHATLHWTALPATDETETPCEPTATALQVIPPNETAPISASWGGGEACFHNHLSVTGFAAGPGGA